MNALSTSLRHRLFSHQAPARPRALMLVAGLGVVAVLGGACSTANKTAVKTPTPSASPSPSPSPSPLPSPSPSPVPSALPSTRASVRPSPTRAGTTPTHAPTGAPAPGATGPGASANQLAAPKAGTYTYALSGSSTSALGTQQDPSGSVLTVNFSQSGSQITGVATSPAQQASLSTTYVLGPSAETLAASSISYPGVGTYSCTYSPPPVFLPNPLTVGAQPSQSWSGGQCSGSITVNVVDQETVSAAGQSWPVFRVHTVIQYTAQSLSATMDNTATYSPTLGTVITSDGTTNGSAGGYSFSTHQVTTLTSHP